MSVLGLEFHENEFGSIFRYISVQSSQIQIMQDVLNLKFKVIDKAMDIRMHLGTMQG